MSDCQCFQFVVLLKIALFDEVSFIRLSTASSLVITGHLIHLRYGLLNSFVDCLSVVNSVQCEIPHIPE